MKKLSQYNTILSIGTNFLIYNALSDRFLVCHHPFEIVDSIINNQTLNPSDELVEKLDSVGFYIDRDKDELSEMLMKVDKVDNDPTTFMLHINPTLDCTFRCWYCYEEHQRGTRMKEDVLENVKLFISKRIREQPVLKYFQLAFFGGEPLMHFSKVAKPLIDFAAQECEKQDVQFSVHFTSNAYLINQRIIDCITNHNASFQITLDGGRQHHDKVRCLPSGRGSFDRIVKNVESLLSHGVTVVLRINYTRENLHSISEIVEELKNRDIQNRYLLTVDFQHVWQDGSKDEKVELTNKIENFATELSSMNIRSIRIHNSHACKDSCYGDKRHHLLVNYNGDVFHCTARDFKPSARAGYLAADGAVVWENNALEHRMSAKLSLPICRECRVAPLCGSGCRQKAIEKPNRDGCPLFFDEDDKDRMVLDRFEKIYLNA